MLPSSSSSLPSLSFIPTQVMDIVPACESGAISLPPILQEGKETELIDERQYEMWFKALHSLTYGGGPGLFTTSESPDGGKLCIDRTKAGQATVSVMVENEILDAIIIDPTHPAWVSLYTVTEWESWAAIHGDTEKRDIAVRRIFECYFQGKKTLDLSNLGLTSLPEMLPGGITELNLANNHLSTLVELPGTLQILRANNNKLNELPLLPTGLRELYINDNKLPYLRQFPVSLQIIDVVNNNLCFLPYLHYGLKSIKVRGNTFNSFPKLPVSVEHVDTPEWFINWSKMHARPPEFFSEIIYIMPDRADEVKGTWAAIALEKNAPEFSLFLQKMCHGASIRIPEFREKFCEWLREIRCDKRLRELSFAFLADPGIYTCKGMRAWTRLQTIRILHHLEEETENIPCDKFLFFARQCYRVQMLEKEVEREINSVRRHGDDIQEYLSLFSQKMKSIKLLDYYFPGKSFEKAGGDESVSHYRVTNREKGHQHNEFCDWLACWKVCQNYLLSCLSPQARGRLTVRYHFIYQRMLHEDALRHTKHDDGRGKDGILNSAEIAHNKTVRAIFTPMIETMLFGKKRVTDKVSAPGDILFNDLDLDRKTKSSFFDSCYITDVV